MVLKLLLQNPGVPNRSLEGERSGDRVLADLVAGEGLLPYGYFCLGGRSG